MVRREGRGVHVGADEEITNITRTFKLTPFTPDDLIDIIEGSATPVLEGKG